VTYSHFGALGSRNPKRCREQFAVFLPVVETLPFEAEARMRASELRHKHEREGEAIGPRYANRLRRQPLLSAAFELPAISGSSHAFPN
jgi:predicted nucleic acid-binding protein